MRKSVLAGIFAYALFFMTPHASAETVSQEYLYSVSKATIKPALVAVNEAQTVPYLALNDTEKLGEAVPAESSVTKTNIEYTVQTGDTLIEIAKQFNITWQRIFYKNITIEHPDTIKPGEVLVIPLDEEQLTERAIPATLSEIAKAEAASRPAQTKTQTTQSASRPASESITVARGSSGGNLYTRGYCTWYVKNMRPDMPNNLGDAVNWVARARAQGMATGSTPQVGAVGQRGNHVVYVEAVNSDGTVTISEMNHVGWNKTSRRTLPANYFTYIY